MFRLNPARLAAASTLALLASAAALAMPQFGSWSQVASIESLPNSSANVNTNSIDGCASLSPDGLTLAFNSFRSGNQEIYFATRSSLTSGFGDPVRLPAPINTTSLEFCPTLVHGGRLYFSSSRHDPAGDLYVSKLGPKGWGAPQRLGSAVNTSGALEEAATFYEDDEGREVMLFSRRPPGPFAGVGGKIYQSIDGARATLVTGGPHSNSSDNRPSVTHDGRTIFWDSLRSGSLGGPDIWSATRSNTSEQWGQAMHLGQLSSAMSDTRPHIGWRGEIFLVSSERTGSEWSGSGPVFPDIWFATRDKAAGN